MSTIRVRGRVGADGTLTFQLPDNLANAEAEVTIEQRASVPAAPPIVARRASDARLRRQHEALGELARSPVLHAGDLDAALRLVTETLARTLEVARASLWMFTPDRAQLRCADTYLYAKRSHEPGGAEPPLVARAVPAFVRALDEEQIVTVANAHGDARVRELVTTHLRPHGTIALLAAPVRVAGQSLGVLRADHAGAPRLWHLEDQNFTVALASTAALALQTAARHAAEAEAARERETSERLLRTILPAPIAERLKRSPGVIADGFEDVTVLFADLVDFTPLAASMSPHALVDLLNDVFSTFDRLAAAHGVEKIKTIGDNYMAVCGLPEKRADHATAMAEMALEMRAAVAELCARRGVALRLRIGLHSGPVVAGVIGINRFIYDLWGETVNVASRMESQGQPARIQVSEATRQRVQGGGYVWQERGTIEVKGVGAMRTYFLEGRSGGSTR